MPAKQIASSMSFSTLLKPEDRVSDQPSLASLCIRIALMSALAPVFFPGCSDPEPSFAEVAVTRSALLPVSAAGAEGSGIRCLDLFFFNDDRLQRLDAYQRIEGSAGAAATGASRSGKKILAVLANSSHDRYDWADIRSLDALRTKRIRLQDEDPSFPLLVALLPVETTNGRRVQVPLRPFTARIEINSLRCDFSGHPYAGAQVEDVRLYLTNVNTSVPLLYDTLVTPTEFINVGRLQAHDLEDFLHPEQVLVSLKDPLGRQTVRPGSVLYCYENTPVETGAGTPPTRLVVEGKLAGEICYWPIEIGRGAWKPDGVREGAAAGYAYRYDITLTRRGLPDPDGRLEPGDLDLSLTASPWTERPETVIPF